MPLRTGTLLETGPHLTQTLTLLSLTGLLIYIKPGSVSQLACGCTISGFFFVWLIRSEAYINEAEHDLQFCAMLSITVTLFGGILLKTDTQKEDPYGTAVLTGLLLANNIAVVVLFLTQMYLAFRKPRPKTQKPHHPDDHSSAAEETTTGLGRSAIAGLPDSHVSLRAPSPAAIRESSP